jgi:hypothetical protein
LSVKHIKSEPLILHAKAKKFPVMDLSQAFIKISCSQPVGRDQTQIIWQEVKEMLVARA